MTGQERDPMVLDLSEEGPLEMIGRAAAGIPWRGHCRPGRSFPKAQEVPPLLGNAQSLCLRPGLSWTNVALVSPFTSPPGPF